jgi:hypothetical protein
MPAADHFARIIRGEEHDSPRLDFGTETCEQLRHLAAATLHKPMPPDDEIKQDWVEGLNLLAHLSDHCLRNNGASLARPVALIGATVRRARELYA